MMNLHQKIKRASKNDKSLWEKIHEQKKNPDRNITKMSDRAATIYFWFILISEIYVFTHVIIPHECALYAEVTRYCLKVMCWFVFIQIVANWGCVRCYDPAFQVTRDIPHEIYETSTGCVSKSEYFCCVDIDRNNTESISKGFEWRWCNVCHVSQPPRSHHCLICNKCILKRDHHCYMCGICIGFRNQRYFVVLNFYVAIASLFGLYIAVSHLRYIFSLNPYYESHIFPVACLYWLFSESVQFYQVLMVFHVYTFWWTSFMSVGFFTWHLSSIVAGKTVRELRQNLRVRSTASISDNFQSVFGPFWGINFIFPAQIIFKQFGDGIHWPNIKPSQN